MPDQDRALMELKQQFVAVQESLTLLQKDVDDINDVVLNQQRELEALQRENLRLEGRIEQLLDTDSLPSPEDEKPPHY